MSLSSDLRQALRAVVRSRGLAALIVLTLALGIGANTAVFGVVNAVLLRPLPYAHGDRLVQLQQVDARDATAPLGISAAELRDYRAAAPAFDGLVEYHTMWFNLLGEGEPERVQTGVVSWNYFEVLGVQPVHGRAFLPSEDAVGAEPVLVLGHGYWLQRFGGDPGVVGRTVEMNDRIHTIVGVMPPVPQYPNDNDVWMPWYACPFRSSDHANQHRAMRMLAVFGRLAPDRTIDGARGDLARVASRMQSDHPADYPEDGRVVVAATDLRETMVQGARTRFIVLLGMAGLVLLIACANVANLTLARVGRREQELAIRATLGASRARLLRQLVLESTVLSLAGGVLGLALAWGLTDLLVAFAARFTPRAQEVGIDTRVLGFTLAVACSIGLLVGAAPALLLGRDLGGRLRDGGRNASGGRRRTRARSVLVAAQVGLACVLLVGATLTARSFLRLAGTDTGFDPERVLTMRLDLDFATRTSPDDRRAFYRPLLDRLATLPGVVSAGLASTTPLTGGIPSAPLQVEGRAAGEEGGAPQVDVLPVSPGYFETLRIPVVRGRAFTAADRDGAVGGVLVNQIMARHYWPGADPVGARVSFDGDRWLTVIGVVGDARLDALEAPPRDALYYPLDATAPLGATLAVRTRGEPHALARRITDVVHAVDPRQPVAFVQTLEEVRSAAVASPRLTATLLVLFAALALAIAAAGITGVAAHAVGQRTREIGIRLALGARPGDAVRMMVRQALVPVVLGLAAGIFIALAGGRAMEGLLFGVTPTDPATYTIVAAILVGIAALAVWLPARRVVSIDPKEAFRADG